MVTLEAEGHACQIETVTGGLLGRLRDMVGARRAVLLLDHALKAEAPAYEKAGFTVAFTQARGESAKCLAEAERLLGLLAGLKLGRDDWLIARGGGSLTDLGALCAGLYRRGMNLALVPTTLLGAVDAAVGGKAAVDFAGAKNQVGLFYLPKHVLVDVAAFASLPRERVDEGLVEAYKTGLLFDQGLVGLVEQGGPLAEIAERSYTAKARLVAGDFREEKGRRDVLNLGHTYGHVVESYHAPNLSHGRAVAFGLAVAAELSRPQLGGEGADRVVAMAKRLGGPWPALPPQEAALGLLMADKKIREGHLRFILLDSFQKPRLAAIGPASVLAAAGEVARA